MEPVFCLHSMASAADRQARRLSGLCRGRRQSYRPPKPGR